MKKLFFISYVLAALAFTGCAKHENPNEIVRANTQNIDHFPQGPTVRILVLDNVEGALVEVKGAYNVYDPATGKKLDRVFFPSSYYMHTTTDGLKWGAEFPGIFQLLIVPDYPSTSILVQGVEYKGAIYAYQVDGTIGFVNELSDNDYAKSMVSDWMGQKKLDREAVAALAIAARGDAFYRSQHPKSKFWDVKASLIGYRGASVCKLDDEFNSIMKETADMVLRTNNGLTWFEERNVPVDAIEKEAEDGRHARAILGRMIPGSEVILVHEQK